MRIRRPTHPRELLRTLLVIIAPVVLSAPAAAQNAGPDFLKESYQCQSPGYAVPFAGHNGTEVVYAAENGIAGRDPKTSLVRWQGGILKHPRRFVDRGDNILMVGEHLQLVTKARGEQVWDFPLNCFPGECNADVVAQSDDRVLVGGFGKLYSMILPVGLADGKQQWPSWLTVCPFQDAAFLGDSVVLLCNGGGSLLQRVDLASRRTLFSATSPQADFKGTHLFSSSRYLFVEGEASGQRKLAVFSSEDGKEVRTFKVKVDGKSVGFLVSPEEGRFVPWQLKGNDWLAWGMDAATGKVIWHEKFTDAEFIGQVGAVAALRVSEGTTCRVVGLDLVTGKLRYDLPLPSAGPGCTLQGEQLFIGLADGPFLVADARTGLPLHVGQLAKPAAAVLDRFYIANDQGRIVLLTGNDVTVFDSTPLTTQTDAVIESLDDGDLDKARSLYARLAPFRHLVQAVNSVRQELVSYRFIRALGAVRTGELDEAVALVQPWLDEHRKAPLDDLLHHYPHLLRVVLTMAVVNEGSADRFLLEVLHLLADRSADPAFMNDADDRQHFVGTIVAIVLGIRNAPADADAFAVLRDLHQRPDLAPLIEGHPYWTRFLVTEVTTTLEAAREAGRIGEYGMAANFLKDLAKLPLAAQIFGATFDPWIDAQGAYLMPADIQARKIPDILKALDGKLAKGSSSLLEETNVEVCNQRCRITTAHCPGTCTLDDECQQAGQRCLKSCTRGELKYAPPQFIMPPGSDGFPSCR